MALLRAFVIRDDQGKLEDLEDVVRVARALAKQVFRVEGNDVLRVLRIWGPDPLFGYVVLVECECSRSLAARLDEKNIT